MKESLQGQLHTNKLLNTFSKCLKSAKLFLTFYVCKAYQNNNKNADSRKIMRSWHSYRKSRTAEPSPFSRRVGTKAEQGYPGRAHWLQQRRCLHSQGTMNRWAETLTLCGTSCLGMGWQTQGSPGKQPSLDGLRTPMLQILIWLHSLPQNIFFSLCNYFSHHFYYVFSGDAWSIYQPMELAIYTRSFSCLSHNQSVTFYLMTRPQ